MAILLIFSTVIYTGSERVGAVPINLVDKSGRACYRIVRPERLTSDTSADVKDFTRSLEKIIGASFKLATDAEGDQTENLSDICEILIGATNRAESILAREELTENDYLIRVIGNKIVITGKSDLMTKRAMDAFLDLISRSALTTHTNIKLNIKRGPYLVALTNTKSGYVEVYDITGGALDQDSLVWSYKFISASGVKLRHSSTHGDVVLAVGSNDYACMVSYPEGRLIWSSNATGNNPHSIELLPNGVVVTAASDGNQVSFFNTDSTKSEYAEATMPLYQAHGVLWDESREVVWAIGWNILTAYRVTLDENGKITVTEAEDLRTIIPSTGSHDLSPVYGSENELWISTHDKVYRFNTESMTLSTDFEGYENISHAHIKGIGNFDDGTTLYIYPDGAYAQWTSKSIYIVKKDSATTEVITTDSSHFYKIRIWDSRYH